LEIAAKHNHNAARWKLGQLYQQGTGVEKNDYKAFQLFLGIARQYKKFGFERVNKRQVSGAFASLAQYLKKGIPDSPIKTNVREANRLFHASAYFGNAQAQFELGEYYTSHPKENPNYVQAARWLVKANRKGHPKAAALLGQLMFDGHGVEHSPEFGLALATNAMMRANPDDRPWVEGIYTSLYGAADEQQRNVATAILEQGLLHNRKIRLRRGSKNTAAKNNTASRSSSRVELRMGLKDTKRQNKPDINELIFNRVLNK
jgi:TPR repeat protein